MIFNLALHINFKLLYVGFVFCNLILSVTKHDFRDWTYVGDSHFLRVVDAIDGELALIDEWV